MVSGPSGRSNGMRTEAEHELRTSQQFYKEYHNGQNTGGRRTPSPMKLAEPTAPDTAQAAVKLAKKGLYVFPICQRDKIPLPGSRGFHEATCDPSEVWERFKGWDYNIAICPGASGHVVVDTDSEKGEEHLRRLWGGVPATLSWTTSRGRHRLYKLPEGALVASHRVAPELDVKSSGGYVVAPPSMHPDGVRYAFENGTKKVARLTRKQTAAIAGKASKSEPPPQENLRAPSMERLSEVVTAIANDVRFASRDAWLAVAYAIKAAALPGSEAEALDLFQSFSAKWKDGSNDPAYVKKEWDSLHPPYRLGFSFLSELAGPSAQDEFDASPEADPPAEPARRENIFLAGATPQPEFIRRVVEVSRYLVDGLFRAGRIGSLSSNPKSGKSTQIGELCSCISRGADWLEFKVGDAHRVLLLALEEHPDDVHERLKQYGDLPNMDVYAGGTSAEPIRDLRELLEAAKAEGRPYSFVAIDTLGRFLKPISDGNDYQENTHALTPLIQLAHDSGAFILCVHHTRKGGRGADPFDSILGSTAIRASFDVNMLYERHSASTTARQLIVEGRGHVRDGSWTVYMNEDGSFCRTVQRTQRDLDEEDVREVLGAEGGPLEWGELAKRCSRGRAHTRRVVERLVAKGEVERVGEGLKGDPLSWALVSASDEFDSTDEHTINQLEN